ncbi:serotriflin-like [Sceloporus undulatus]|uniref:serotriflin-like n=1 Tax=Sceloporus undulatus TaxID=8520 RepID=UPI001C4B3BBE|nr:serotriflin-like [Sceloporus undulatus]XP_042336776.1 serotriflin-like [Sceloporus undulatus]
MLLSTVLLPLAVVLQQALGQHIPGKMAPKHQKEILDRFNAIRREVQPTARNMMKMVWSDKASESARRWVSQCQFRISPIKDRTVDGFPCGETLSQTKTASSWKDVIESWASTKPHFKYGIGPTDPKKNIYSYTQLIWHNTYMVGCAVGYCKENTFPFLYLCHYCPGGNSQDKVKRPYDEGPPCADCPNECDDKLCMKACPYKNVYSECGTMKNLFTCQSDIMSDACPATCKCST